MLSWVVKVVPQPPDLPKNQEVPATAPPPAPPPAPPEKKVTFKEEAPNTNKNNDAPAAEGSRPGTAVLSWISSAMPQPVNVNNSANKEESPPPSKGMIAWISQGLEKVVPHPELKNKDPPPAEKPKEVRPVSAPAAPVTVEVKKSPEEKAENSTSMIEWIKSGIEKMVPQPEHLKAKAENTTKNEAPPAPKVEAAPPANPPPPNPAPPPPPPAPAPKPAAEETSSTEQQTNVVGWIVNEIGRMLPQPVLKSENSESGPNTVVNSSQTKNDLVLEDLEQNNEKQEAPAQKEDTQPKKQAEDTEAQTEHPSLKDSIKKETEEAVLAQMEERLQLERLAAARAAEELALKAAEEAVRQLEKEQAAKIIIDSINEPQDHSLVDMCPADSTKAPDQNVQANSAKEMTPSSAEVELVSENKTEEVKEAQAKETKQQDPPITEQKKPEPQQSVTEKQESKPITQQPEPQATEAPATNADQAPTGTTEETGCGPPAICSPFRTFMLRFPVAAEYLENCRKLMHDHYLTPPKLSLPSPPAELALLTQEIAELPKQAQQYCMGIINKIKGINTHFQTAAQGQSSNQNGENEQSQSTQPTTKQP